MTRMRVTAGSRRDDTQAGRVCTRQTQTGFVRARGRPPNVTGGRRVPGPGPVATQTAGLQLAGSGAAYAGCDSNGPGHGPSRRRLLIAGRSRVRRLAGKVKRRTRPRRRTRKQPVSDSEARSPMNYVFVGVLASALVSKIIAYRNI
jgi:hypothetical protein